jgi:hypothetical protein
MQALEVRRVKSSEDLLNPGDYVFIPARPPEITIEKKPIVAPVGFWKTLIWALFNKKYELIETKTEAWPSVETHHHRCPTHMLCCRTHNAHEAVLQGRVQERKTAKIACIHAPLASVVQRTPEHLDAGNRKPN